MRTVEQVLKLAPKYKHVWFLHCQETNSFHHPLLSPVKCNVSLCVKFCYIDWFESHMYFQSWRSCHLFACVGTLLTLDYSFDETSPKFTFFIHFSEHLQCFCNLGGSQPSQVLRPTSYGKKSGGEPGWQSALPVELFLLLFTAAPLYFGSEWAASCLWKSQKPWQFSHRSFWPWTPPYPHHHHQPLFGT